MKSQREFFRCEKGIVPVCHEFICSQKTANNHPGPRRLRTIPPTILGAGSTPIGNHLTARGRVLTADPRLINEARTIPTFRISTPRRLAFFWRERLQPENFEPVFEFGDSRLYRNSVAKNAAQKALRRARQHRLKGA